LLGNTLSEISDVLIVSTTETTLTDPAFVLAMNLNEIAALIAIVAWQETQTSFGFNRIDDHVDGLKSD
jgi:hypothetical protein